MTKQLPYFFYINHGNAEKTVHMLQYIYPGMKFQILSKEHPFNGRWGWSIYVGHGEGAIHVQYMSPAALRLEGIRLRARQDMEREQQANEDTSECWRVLGYV
jgi:hypothetical protein